MSIWNFYNFWNVLEVNFNPEKFELLNFINFQLSKNLTFGNLKLLENSFILENMKLSYRR
jgi:hypothetical protein